eukprot:Awhi_evm2s8536
MEEDMNINDTELSIDNFGRIGGTSEIGLNFDTNVYSSTIVLSEHKNTVDGNQAITNFATLISDCEKVYDGVTTHWIGKNDVPRFTLERLALSILEKHTAKLNIPKEKEHSVGAEWWVQVRNSNDGIASDDEEDLESSEDLKKFKNIGNFGVILDDEKEGVGFHWDKDEDLVDEIGININPQIATVTYLTNSGQPTVIVNRRPPFNYEDVDSLYTPGFSVTEDMSQVCKTSEETEIEGYGESRIKEDDNNKVWISYPKKGRHLSFDGRYLHAAPARLLRVPSESKPEGKRITFLCNIWIDHHPTCILRPENEDLEPLGLSDFKNTGIVLVPVASSSPSSAFSEFVKYTCNDTSKTENLTECFTSIFGPTRVDHQLTFGIPVKSVLTELVNSTKSSSTFFPPCIELKLEGGAVPEISPAEGMELTTIPTINGKDVTWKKFLDLYRQTRLLVIEDLFDPDCSGGNSLGNMSGLRSLFNLHADAIKSRWNVENGGETSAIEQILLTDTQDDDDEEDKAKKRTHNEKEELPRSDKPWYLSFVVNESTKPGILKDCLKLSPFETPRKVFPEEGEGIIHSKNMWVFAGQNPEKEPMKGRPEHTDKISFSGTWHAQLSGSKTWKVRPCEGGGWSVPIPDIVIENEQEDEEEESDEGEIPESAYLKVEVKAGSLLVINTKLWFHQTEIPCTQKKMSVSIAREFVIHSDSTCEIQPAEEEDDVDMDNQEDVWATSSIPEGHCIIENIEEPEQLANFRQSANPNLMFVEEGSKRRLISIRGIEAGESMTLPFSEDEA